MRNSCLVTLLVLFSALLPAAVSAGPIHEAAKTGMLDVLKLIIAHGSDKAKAINEQDHQGNTPLHYAVAEGQVEAVVALLKQAGIKVDPRNKKNETPLHLAGTRGRPFIATRLVEQGAEINALDGSEQTALCRAAHAGHPEIIQVLLNKGADINGVRMEGYEGAASFISAPLDCAIAGGQRPIINLLVEKGADIGGASMGAAIASGDRDLIRHLLGKGGRINYGLIPNDGNPRGFPSRDLLQFILDQDRGGRLRATPLLFQAVYSGDQKRLATLLDLGIHVNGRDLYGNTPLHRAAEFGNVEFCRVLLNKGAGVNERTERGNTPLHKAIAGGHEVVARLLVAAGAHPNARNEIGTTPLHMAAARNLSGVVGLLLSKGADMKLKNERGMTAGQVALEYGFQDLARVLGATVPPSPPVTSAPPVQALPPIATMPHRAEEPIIPEGAHSSKPLFASHPVQTWRSGDPVAQGVTLKHPSQAENGEVVPFSMTLSSGLRAGDQVALFVNDEWAGSVRPTGNVVLTGFSTRFRMPGTGEIRALITRKDGTRQSATAAIKITVPAGNPGQGGSGRSIKVKARFIQNQNELLVLQDNPMGRTGYTQQLLMHLQGGTVEITLSPWFSKDPLVGIRVPQALDGAHVLSYAQR